MSQALPAGLRSTALELHALLQDLDPAAWREDVHAAARERLAALYARVRALRQAVAADRRFAAVQARLAEVADRLEQHLPRMNRPSADLRAEWSRLREHLQPAYESLAATLRRYRLHVPSLRPTNYARNVFHVAWGLCILALIEVVATPAQLLWAALGAAAFAWSCETLRRVAPSTNKWLTLPFRKVIHPHEYHRVNSATWYVTALVLLAATGNAAVQATAVAVLAFADPAAALIGRRWGRTKLVHGRSLEGTLAFTAVGAAVAFGALRLWHADLDAGAAAIVAVAAAVAGAVAELLSRRVDDNFSIPVVAALGACLALWLLGLSPLHFPL